jgi:DNA-binding PadR family transcriptional regulator
VRHESQLKPQWFQILLAVSDTRRHGAAIRDEVLRQTDGNVRLWPASLYGSLKDLVELGYIREAPLDGAAAAGDRRNFYEITKAGRIAVQREIERLEETIAMAVGKHVRVKNA